MRKFISFVLSIAMLLSGINAMAADTETKPVTGGDGGSRYIFNLGATEVNGNGTYDYSDEYMSIRTAIGSSDSVTAENGLYFSGPSCKETPTSAADSNRYILLKPVYDGKITFTIKFTNASSSAKGRVWVNDFSTTEFDSVDLTTLQKGVGTQLGKDATSSSAQTVSFDVTAGNTYSLHTYNRTSYITNMYYETPVITSTPSPIPTAAPTPTPEPFTDAARKVEYLTRGTVAIKTDSGVFLSWRLLGTESADTSFDVYKNGEMLLSGYEKTNYTDAEGTLNDVYQVIISGGDISKEKKTTVMEKDYIDIPISRPVPDVAGNALAGEDYTYTANDATVADLDGDGEYEYILKWDPTNSQDNYYSGYTGNVYVDAYETDGTLMWRIDMGVNIRAGAHYTQFIAYDFDCDGKAEIAIRTAPGSKDATGAYVTEVGLNLTEGDNSRDYRNTDGRITTAPDYLTMFNGETGAAMQTVDFYVQRGDLGASSGWGGGAADNGSYSERYLAGVAYLDGIKPSLLMCRGYYYRATVGAYSWDGENFELVWMRDDKTKSADNLYGKGAHSLSIADVDNDGRDEVVYGAAVINDNGEVMYETDLQHGDALHVSDFDNDGDQEVFMVHEHGYSTYGAELHDAKTGEIFVKMGATEDVGRGVMGNIISSNPGSEFWSNANGNLYSQEGKVLSSKKPSETNFLIWWDGDLEREILDATRIVKYTLDGSTLTGERIKELYGTHSNNGTKQNPSLSADIWGDWREEAIYPTNDNNFLRIYTSTIPTDYKLPTFMHDTQYRCAIAWQNAGYNQPPHPSFYVGSEKIDYPAEKVEMTLSEVEYIEPEYRTVSFHIADGSGAEISINENIVTADENGKAEITFDNSRAYDFTVLKEGFKTYYGTINPEDTDISVSLDSGDTVSVIVSFRDWLGNELKQAETAGEAGENSFFTIPEELLMDFTAQDGTIYEFDPDATKDITVRAGDDVELIFKKKLAPVHGDSDITRINFGKNGFNKNAVSAIPSEYTQTNGGVKYGLFNGEVEANLKKISGDSFYMEFDLLFTEGNGISVTPYADEVSGNPIVFTVDGEEMTVKCGETSCTYTSDSYKKAGYWYNQPMHVTVMSHNGAASVIVLNCDNSIVYASCNNYDIGISGINKLVFSSDRAGLSEIESYTVGGATQGAYPFGRSINLTVPSERNIKPMSAIHKSEYTVSTLKREDSNTFETGYIDLMGGLSYAMAEESEGVTVDENGLVSVSETAQKGTYYVNIMYNGLVFKTVPVNVVDGAYEAFWSEDFEGESHKFSLVYDTNSMAQFHVEDPSKSNAREGKIYGTGARSGGNTGSNSSEIDTTGYSDVSVEMDFKLDATAYNYKSYIALLGEKNESDSLSSDKQILAIEAIAGGGNGYWSEISLNGVNIFSQIDSNASSSETAGAGYNNGTISFNVLNRDSTGWLHLSAIPDFETQTVNVTITKNSDNSILYSGQVDFVNEVDELKHIFISGGRQYGTAWVDDIEVIGLNPEGTYEPEVTPTPEPISAVIDSIDFETGDTEITGTVGIVIDVNDVSQEESADVYMALYRKDRLISVSGKKSELVTGANVIDFYDIAIEGTDATDLAAKVFIWKSGTQQPITDALAMDVVPRAKGVFYENDFEGVTESIFVSNRTDRYTVAPFIEGENTFEKTTAVGNGSNGAFITTEAFCVEEGVNYTMSFDMALTPTSAEYVQASCFIIRSAADDLSDGLTDSSDYILNLTQATTSTVAEENTTWYINGDSEEIVELVPGEWYKYTLDVIDGEVYLAISDVSGNAVLKRKAVAQKSINGGLGGIYYATRRYSAGMAIDNILVKEYKEN